MTFSQSIARIWHIPSQRLGLLWSLTIRHLAMRYQGSVFGFLWTLINPMLTIAVYAFVFTNIMKVAIEHYWIYLFNGVILWSFISSTIIESPIGLSSAGHLVARAGLPSEMVPFRITLANLISYLIIFPVFILVQGYFRGFFLASTQAVVLVPLAFLFSLGLSFILTYIGILYRDVHPIIQVIVQLLFFTAPVTYQPMRFGGTFAEIINYSPITMLVRMNAEALFYGQWLRLADFAYLAVWIAAIWVVALLVHRHLRAVAVEAI